MSVHILSYYGKDIPGAFVGGISLTFSGTGHERFLVTQGSYDTQEIADIVRSRLPEDN
jgi:hypothetical protein